MHARRLSALSAAGIAALTGALCADDAHPQGVDAFAAMEIERRHAVSISSPNASEPSSANAVLVNEWALPIEIGYVRPRIAGGDLTSQTSSALRELDRRLSELGATRFDILRLNAFVEAGHAGEPSAVLEAIERYLSERDASSGRPAEYHAQALHAVLEVADLPEAAGLESAIVLVATILDPGTTTTDERSDLAWSYQPQARRFFLIGPGSMVSAAVPSGRRASAPAALRAALNHIRELLSRMSGTSEDIDEMIVYFDPSAGIEEDDLAPVVDQLFVSHTMRVGDARPRVRYVEARPVNAASGAVAVEVSGIVTHYGR